MQPIDVVLPTVLAVVALGALRTARQRRTLRMPIGGRLGSRSGGAIVGLVALTSATTVQLLVEGWRWQLGPAALTAVLLSMVLIVRASGRPAVLAATVAVVAFAGAAASVALSWALPMRILPQPDGPHAVGTTTIVVVDEGRTERYGPTPGEPREIVVQLWYPAAPDAPVVPAPLVPQAPAFTSLGAAELGLPRFALSHVGRIPSNATLDAPALDATLPVALLAHGWTGFRTIQTDLAEQLASLGWVVAAADHRYGALVTTFPDGRADLFDPEALPEFGTVSDDVYALRSRALIRTFADDLALVLRTLDRTPPALLAGRLDLDRVAFLGHSTGGGAAIAACAVEPRCGAVVGFDPWVEPIEPGVLERGLVRPLLSLRTEDWVERPNEIVLQALHRLQRENGRIEGLVGLDGALHRDFTLIGSLSPAAGLLGLTGDTPGAQTRAATIAWTTRFLEHHLRAVGTDPLAEPPDAPVGRLEVAP
jgi:dienelactone hydrolase